MRGAGAGMLHSVQLSVRSLSAADILCHRTRKPQSGDPTYGSPDIQKCQARLREILVLKMHTQRLTDANTSKSSLFPANSALTMVRDGCDGRLVLCVAWRRCGVCGCQPSSWQWPPCWGVTHPAFTQPLHPSLPDQRSYCPSTLCLTRAP